MHRKRTAEYRAWKKNYDKQYRANNASRIRARQKVYYNHPARKQRQYLTWYQREVFRKSDRGRMSIKNTNALRRYRKVDNSVTTQALLDLFHYQKGVCALCPARITIRSCKIDHIETSTRGGVHTIKNIQFTCQHCNRVKYNK